MTKYMVTDGDVKKSLGIESFRNMTKEKLVEFVSAIPNMDKDVAIKIIEQFPDYTESANSILGQLNTLCNNAISSNNESQKEAIRAYQKILDPLGELLKQETITTEQKVHITDQMIIIAYRISAKDTENKGFLDGVYKHGASIMGGALVLGAVILGVNVKSTKIPILKK